MKNLNEFQKGDSVLVKKVDCGKEFNCRLTELGLFNGAEIEIIKNDNFGPLLIKILDSKIALGRNEANKIYVKKI